MEKGDFMKRVLEAIKAIFIYAIIIVLVLLFVGNISSQSDALYDVIKYRTYTILTGSMQPKISPGDVIVTTNVGINELEVGDIITFNRDGMTATHRIIELNDDSILTQGDNNNVHDNPIEYEQIIGKYLFKIPQLGRILQFTSSVPGIILVVTLVITYFIYEGMIKDSTQKNKW